MQTRDICHTESSAAVKHYRHSCICENQNLIGRQTESSEIAQGLSVSMVTSQNDQQKWIRLPAAFFTKEIPVEPCEITTSG